jgi:DMSO/TMAO reductase YedYZ molybdopterin-dependent catalytic subunit
MLVQELSVTRLTGTHLIVVCQETYAQALATGVPARNVTLIPNGIDTRRFTPERNGADFRAAIGVPSNAPLVGFVGRLSPEKGPDRFLFAAERIRQSRPDVHFVMIGDGPMREELEIQIGRGGFAGCLHMVEVRHDIETAYPAFDLLLQTSRSEGMPLVVLEAMACGVPVVAVGIGGVAEVVEHGSTGWLVSPAQWEDISRDALRLLADPQRLKRMGLLGRERVQARFDPAAAWCAGGGHRVVVPCAYVPYATVWIAMLPPGQSAIRGFPRFGTHFDHPPPAVPAEPALEVAGAVAEPFSVPLHRLATLPRREVVADFHCVAGWSATGLRWEGVPFAVFHREVLARRGAGAITHVKFVGSDGHWSVALLEDVLGDDVLLTEHLDGRPLDGNHGAPLRLVSPRQYGFINTKHLCRIELLSAEPATCVGSASTQAHVALRLLGCKRFVRARVWEQERHRFLPPRLVREISRLLIPGIRRLSARR